MVEWDVCRRGQQSSLQHKKLLRFMRMYGPNILMSSNVLYFCLLPGFVPGVCRKRKLVKTCVQTRCVDLMLMPKKKLGLCILLPSLRSFLDHVQSCRWRKGLSLPTEVSGGFAGSFSNVIDTNVLMRNSVLN